MPIGALENPAYSWLQIDKTTGSSGSTVIHLKTLSKTVQERAAQAILDINSSNGQAQKGKGYSTPYYIPSPITQAPKHQTCNRNEQHCSATGGKNAREWE
jgi:hypothetical protein